MPTCTTCKKSLPSENFYVRSGGRLRGECIPCTRVSQAAYREKNRDAIRAQKKEAHRLNPGPARERARAWAIANRAYVLQQAKERAKTPKAVAGRRRYYLNNRERLLQYNKARHTARVKEDPEYRLLTRLRTRVYQALRGHRKSARTWQLIGTDLASLKAHLEASFSPGMTWENYGAWHVDHIKPCCSFNMLDPAQQRACFHYSNLQPLWAADNMKKSGKFPADKPQSTAS